MRITFKTVNRHMQNVIMNRYADLASLQEQLATGKRLLRPSDDPVDTSNDLKLRSKLSQLYQYKRNIDDGMGYMSVTDTAMMSMNDLMQRLRELAIQGSSDTLSDKERFFIEKEVEQLLLQLVSITNTRYKGDYIFGGVQTKITPFPIENSVANTPQDYTDLNMAYYDASAFPAGGAAVQLRDAFDTSPITDIIPGSFELSVRGVTMVEGTDYTIDYVNGTITILATSPNLADLSVDVLNGIHAGPPPVNNYSVDGFNITFNYLSRGKDIFGDTVAIDGDVLREIEAGVVMPININGQELTYDHTTNTDLFDVIIGLGQDLLQNNRAGIESGIGRIDITMKNLLAAQSKNGARVNRFETTLERNELQYTETTRQQSELEDADFAETASNFSLTETVYNAALQSAARVIQNSLVNFL